LVPVFAYGPGIKKNYLIDEDAVIYTLDIAPTISHLFGVRKHKIWRGRVFNEIFEEKTPADEYTGKSDLNCNKSENETSEEKSSL
jgi:arylsulfatase A-like enzyme